MININEEATKGIVAGIDWMSVTDTFGNTPLHYSIDDSLQWNECRGKLGYDRGYKHISGIIRLASTIRKDMGIHMIYSGSALRRIELDTKITPMDLLEFHIGNHDHVARLDVCLDFVNCGLTVDMFVNEWHLKNVKTRAKSATFVQSITHSGSTFYIGSQKKRKKLVRIYDKASEQGITGDWIRMELQVMGKPATQMSRGLIESDDKATYIAQCISGYTDFPNIIPFVQAKNGYEGVELGSISSNKGDTREWIRNQVIPALSKEIIADAQYWVQFRMELAKSIQELSGKEIVK